MSRVISAQQLLETRDCLVPGCIRDAARGARTCSVHEGWEPDDSPLALIDLREKREERIVTEKPAAQESAPAPPGKCKIDGCQRAIFVREDGSVYDRGPFAKLCEIHMETAREEIGNRARGARAATRGGRTAEKREPAPQAPPRARSSSASEERAAEPAPGPGVVGFEARAARLVDAGRALDEARAALEQAQQAHQAALDAWNELREQLAVT